MNWQAVRAWVYRLSAVLAFVYVVVGVAQGEASSDELTAAFTTLLAALAAANTPTREKHDLADSDS